MQTLPNSATIKAIFFDIDGTLISPVTHRIPQTAIDALCRAKEKGYLVFAATGRHQVELLKLPQVDLLPFDGMVTMGGQYCTSNGRLVYCQPIPRQDLEQLVAYCIAHQLPCLFSDEDSVFLSHVNDYVVAAYRDIATVPPKPSPAEKALDREIYQVSIVLNNGHIPDIVHQLSGCSYAHWHNNGIDLVNKNGGKWNGILQLARSHNIQPHEIMTMGDNNNDVEMLRQAPLSVAMGNASEDAKAAATHITATVDEDGVAKALSQLLGI